MSLVWSLGYIGFWCRGFRGFWASGHSGFGAFGGVRFILKSLPGRIPKNFGMKGLPFWYWAVVDGTKDHNREKRSYWDQVDLGFTTVASGLIENAQRPR